MLWFMFNLFSQVKLTVPFNMPVAVSCSLLQRSYWPTQQVDVLLELRKLCFCCCLSFMVLFIKQQLSHIENQGSYIFIWTVGMSAKSKLCSLPRQNLSWVLSREPFCSVPGQHDHTCIPQWKNFPGASIWTVATLLLKGNFERIEHLLATALQSAVYKG